MKRCDGLAPLSREHHAALVLAKTLTAAHSGRGADDGLLAAVLLRFDRELEPHFRVEEQALLPLLKAAGEIELVARTLREHTDLRDLIRRIRARDEACLHPFGAKLDAHVRFEERALFPVAQVVLTPESLARAADHANHPRTASQQP